MQFNSVSVMEVEATRQIEHVEMEISVEEQKV